MRRSPRLVRTAVAAAGALLFSVAATGGAVGASSTHARTTGSPPAASASPSLIRGARDGVVVDDVTIDVPYGPAVPAYIVRPSGRQAPGADAGILFLHWLGQIHDDRTEYLAEAVGLAAKGVVSVLPEGTFPWVQAPPATPATR